MGQITVRISDDLENEFRKLIARKSGYRKGQLTIAIEEALDCWIKQNKKITKI